MKKEVENWLDSAKYDLETDEGMFEIGKYIYTIFMCRLAMEKVLKAKIQEITGITPPKSHSLRYLLKLSNLEPTESISEFISKLSDVSIVTRYPEDSEETRRAYNQEAAEKYLAGAKEAFQWVRQFLES